MMNGKSHSAPLANGQPLPSRQFLMPRLAAAEPAVDLKATLRSILQLLGPILHFEGLVLLLRDSGDHLIQLYAIEPDHLESRSAPSEVTIDPELSTLVLDQQQSIVVPDVDADERFPEARRKARDFGLRSFCILPILTSSHRSGALTFGKTTPRHYSRAELATLAKVAADLAPLIEGARIQEESRQRETQIARERDDLALLLEINNFIISHLTLKDLIVAVSSTLRGCFHHNYAGLWVLTDQNRLQCAGLDFPDGRGFISNVEFELDANQVEELNSARPQIISREEITTIPAAFAEPLLREGIRSQVFVPLRSARRLLGFLAIGSIKEHCFCEDDLPLFTQVAAQVALATENALVFQELSRAHEQLRSEKLYLESELSAEYNFSDIIGKSAAVKAVLEQVAIVSQTDATVLLLGETGTGKELIARAIHNLSERRQNTFVRLNCAAIPSGLVESELFGHERGAFTGALAQKIGRFELANKGTLLLDEVGDIPLEVQIKLLRTLQEKEFERLGSTRTLKVDVRVVAATNRDLSELIKSGQFREDLFYRLNVFPIRIPPLRERVEDIPLLVQHFVSRFSRRMRKEIRSIPASSLEAMQRMQWPGNIRELENFIERAVILTRGDTLYLPLTEPGDGLHLAPFSAPTAAPPSPSTLLELERRAMLDALRKTNGLVSGPNGAAALLGLKRTTFHSKMRRLNLRRSDLWHAPRPDTLTPPPHF